MLEKNEHLQFRREVLILKVICDYRDYIGNIELFTLFFQFFT